MGHFFIPETFALLITIYPCCLCQVFVGSFPASLKRLRFQRKLTISLFEYFPSFHKAKEP